MEEPKLVSICVPVYGVEKYIERCARSLFEQTYQNIEYVFVNDCTPDHSIDVLNQVLCDYPERSSSIKVISHSKNRGLAAARNTGVENASGEFILWVDSDDSIDITTVEKLINIQNIHNADIVCYNIKTLYKGYEVINDNGDYEYGRALSLLMLEGTAPHELCGHLIRKCLYTDNNVKAIEGLNWAEDYQVMPKLAYYATRVSTLHEALYYYDRTSENSYSNTFSLDSFHQSWDVACLIDGFFADKGQDFVISCEIGRLKKIATHLKRLADIPYSEMEYGDLISKLTCIDQRLYKNVSFHERIVLYLKRKQLVHFYNIVVQLVQKVYKYRAICGASQ